MAAVKLLRRSTTNKSWLGVCGGLGEYFGIDPVVIRVALVILTVATGFVPGLIAYLLTALVMPEATK